MHWYLVHTKAKQEKWALQNLEQQGYQCYLPTLRSEKLQSGILTVIDEPLFPRYLFIQLGLDNSAQSWTPVRSTRGVSRLVTFGTEPAKVDAELVKMLKYQEVAMQEKVEPLFKPGERVRLVNGAFAGLEGIYQLADGEQRVIVLIELLSKPLKLGISPTHIRKAS